MISKILVLSVALLLQGCATSPKTDALLKDHSGLAESSKLSDVPFIKQSKNHCGPASLAMLLEYNNKKVSLDELSSQMITPAAHGTYATDLITAVRRQGMIAIRINDLKSLLTEVSAGNPVLVFQNMGFGFMPKWHYAVVVGHDLDGPDIILHSGRKKFLKTDMRFFERTWKLADYWGIVVLQPGKLAASVSDLGHTEGISGLEQVKKLVEAKISYEAVLKKWPQSLPALIGMGNVLYAKEEYPRSVRYLKKAALYHPSSGEVWHNLATAQGAAGQFADARESALKALKLVEGVERAHFKKSLEQFLTLK